MGARRVIDRVAAAARGAPFEARELIDEARGIKQFQPAAVEEGERADVQLRFGLLEQL